MKINKLKQIIFISVPEELTYKIANFDLNPAILLPIEVPEGMNPSEWNPSDLNWEMIISGMLKILAYDSENENINYYRDFINNTRPSITAELTQSAIIKTQSSDFDLAEEIFLALIGLNPHDLRSRLNLILLYENKMNYYNNKNLSEFENLSKEIDSMYAELLLNGEELPDIYFNAAWYYFNKHEFKRAYELGQTYLTMGEDEVKRSEAEKLVRECSELKDTDKMYRDAYALITQDQDDEGLELISQFLQENDGIWNAWFLKGWALRKLSRFSEAMPSFIKALELRGNHPEILNELAICSLEIEDYESSRQYLEEALKLEPENLKVISNMGILALKQGKRDEASSFFRTVLELDPDDKIAAEYLVFLKNH